ncbi:hypothetical protein GON26_18285 [Flavobacterium sp. GA093]|uniref:Uncharacterized protein n=1 Tax=Flavobacterium hydrocarbonoxydans TaxID=2683249 RepID=A0A6I4NUY4_9FLAO|nr:hypothetical protein [Flavobacterium hydrocarbonoxydans]MWB96315.1 hypothetical protein [Flavobacterium hydrocarbonoxydans]
MKYLTELTPAEILVLTKESVTHKELLKITFIDLLFKQVLKIIEVERKPHVRQDTRVYEYVVAGPNFKSYPSKNHERIFLSSFDPYDSVPILFRNLVKIGYQKSRTLEELKNDVIKTPALRKCFHQNFFQKMFYGYSLTEYGTELKRKIKKEIQDAGNQLSGLNSIENQKAVELIQLIGANIFILVNIDYGLLHQIDMDLGLETTKINTLNSGSGCSGYSSGFDHFSVSFDSGCSGDSGCGSGCSGCGGCGGD